MAKKNSRLLYDMMIDFITQNDMEVEELIGVCESVKLEYAISAVLKVKMDQEDEEEESEQD